MNLRGPENPGPVLKPQRPDEYLSPAWAAYSSQDGLASPMQLPHSVHIHGLQFQIIGINVDHVDLDVWETVREGPVDEGWQDSLS